MFIFIYFLNFCFVFDLCPFCIFFSFILEMAGVAIMTFLLKSPLPKGLQEGNLAQKSVIKNRYYFDVIASLELGMKLSAPRPSTWHEMLLVAAPSFGRENQGFVQNTSSSCASSESKHNAI